MAEELDTFLPVQGLRLRCRVDGAAGAPWLVFSNSLMTDLSLWDDQVAAYAGRFRILRYDQRGHGGSSMLPGPCRFDDLADDLIAVLDAFGVDSSGPNPATRSSSTRRAASRSARAGSTPRAERWS